MSHPSNRLYSGELDGDPLAALQAIVDELNYEARFAESTQYGVPPDATDLEMAARFHQDAKEVEIVRSRLVTVLNATYEKFAKEVREERIGGEMSTTIADALESGCWEECAI